MSFNNEYDKYGLISKNGLALITTLNKSKNIRIDTKWETTRDFQIELDKLPPQILDSMQAIIMLDTGLSNGRDTDASAEEMMVLQDIMVAKQFNHLKLYLITRDLNLYNKLKGNINGQDGIFYENAEMFYMSNQVSISQLTNIMKGGRDKTGIYSRSTKMLGQVERLELEKETLINDAQRVSKESLEFGSSEPVSELNQEEVLGSRQNDALRKEEEKKVRRLQAEIDKIKKDQASGKLPKQAKVKTKRDKNSETTNTNKTIPTLDNNSSIELVIDYDEPEQEEQINTLVKAKAPRTTSAQPSFNENVVEKQGTLIKRDVNITRSVNTGVPTVAELTELYNQLAPQSTDTIEKKLTSDKGVITVIGNRGSGVSGFVAQTADTYAMLGKRVLIIDLDILMRYQTVYFPSYSDAVQEHKGASNSLVKLTQNNSIKDNAVPVTSMIDVLSNEKTNNLIQDGFHSTITSIFESVIDDAVQYYDIVLIDLPLNYLSFYIRHISLIDKNVFVLPNKFYDVEDFFSIQLQDILNTGDIFSNELISKSLVVINKYRPDYRDTEGFQMNRLKIKELLLSAGSPYDRIPVIGEIPEYKAWEEQYSTKVRYIWTDDLALTLYKKVVSKIL